LGKKGPPPEKMAALFRLKYVEGVADKEKLAEKLCVSKSSVCKYEKSLERKLAQKIGQVSPSLLSFVCPECLEARVYEDAENGEKVCHNCGYVAEQQPLMTHRLPFDETYAFENPLVFNKSLGGTADWKCVSRVLTKVRGNEEKTEAVEGVISLCKNGSLTPFEAAQKIREILIRGGAEEIAEAIRETDDPKEAARRIVNMFDAIPIRQIMTLHDVHEPQLVRKMKEYGERFRKDSGLDRTNPVCDPDLFSVALGALIEKVGGAAVLEPYIQHSPRDLAAACLVKTVKKMNPKIRIEGRIKSLARPEAVMYVDHVIQLVSKGREKEWTKRRETLK
jgi:hypothetical protein